jgi:hypothetical protein
MFRQRFEGDPRLSRYIVWVAFLVILADGCFPVFLAVNVGQYLSLDLIG